MAQFNLGACYRDGYGVEQSFSRAAEYFSMAAAQDYPNAKHSLGAIYANGNDIEGGQNLKKARNYLLVQRNKVMSLPLLHCKSWMM